MSMNARTKWMASVINDFFGINEIEVYVSPFKPDLSGRIQTASFHGYD